MSKYGILFVVCKIYYYYTEGSLGTEKMYIIQCWVSIKINK